jgi:hypothetical protein
MPGGALLSLVSYGSANVLLNDNPDFTYYYKVFKKYSHFSFETVEQPLDGPNELFYDQPIQLRLKIPRIGDLLTDLVFACDIPDIYSKYVTPTNNRPFQYEFQWSRYIGVQMLSNVAFFVGGQKIQEFDSDYIIAKAHADYDTDKLFKWRQLVGDVHELTNPAKGVWAGGKQRTGYPSVIKANISGPQFNRPSIFGQTLYVPLPLWFTTSPAQALPLVGLQYQECEIQLTMRPINQLYTILDPSGYVMSPGYRVVSSQATILSNQATYQPYYDASGQFSAFTVDIDYTTPPQNTWFFKPRMECTYAFVTQPEQQIFASTPLRYLVYQLSKFNFTNLVSRTLYDLDVHNPVVRLLLIPRRNDQVPTRNAIANWTNWWNYPSSPWSPTPGADYTQNNILSSGLLIPNSQKDIIQSMRILLDGTEVQQEQLIGFYTKYIPYKYTMGGSTDESQLMPVVSFSIESPSDQPSGSVNASRIRLFQLEVNPYPLPLNSTYAYNLTIYAESINFFIVESGTGALKYMI